MKPINIILSFALLFFIISCSGSSSAEKAKELAPGVYQQGSWIFDMKELPNGKDIIPFYTIGTLSTNVIRSVSTDGQQLPLEMGVSIYFKLGKKGEDKNKIVGGYFESTATNPEYFNFPRCLSVCPVNVEIIDAQGGVNTSKATYSRPNNFKMDMEDLVLADLVQQKQRIRLRIPVSINKQNTTFEWFEFDFTDFTAELND